MSALSDAKVDSYLSVVHLLSVYRVSRILSIFYMRECNKPKASTTLGVRVHDDCDIFDSTILAKSIVELPLISVNAHSENA